MYVENYEYGVSNGDGTSRKLNEYHKRNDNQVCERI